MEKIQQYYFLCTLDQEKYKLKLPYLLPNKKKIMLINNEMELFLNSDVYATTKKGGDEPKLEIIDAKIEL